MSDMQIINHVLAFLTNRFGAFCHVTIDDAVNTIAAVDPVSADELDRLRTELAKRQWQPIKTAPKDGTDILVYRPDEIDGGFDAHADVDYWKNGSWWHSRRDQQPTHWMPIPDPPKETE